MKMFNTYFSAKPILNKYNKALFYMFLSMRSDGKTFDCKARTLEEYDKNKTQKVYLRRYKNEITEKMYSTFFNEVLRIEPYTRLLLKYEFKCSKTAIYIRPLGSNDKWDIIVYLIPLSISGKLKSQIDGKRITEIDFDELIPLDKRYLNDEVDLVLEFYKTVDRERYTTKLCLFGNKVDIFNPYFDYFNIDIDITKPKIREYKNGTFLLQVYQNEEHKQVAQNSPFNELIKGTKYEDYNNGKTLNNITIKNESINGAIYLCSFKTEIGEGSIYQKENKIIISDRQRKDGYIITDRFYNTGREEYIMPFGNYPRVLKNAYYINALYFTNNKSYNYFTNILKKCNR